MLRNPSERRETARRALRVTAAVVMVLSMLVSMSAVPVAAQEDTEPCEFGPPVPGQDTTDEEFEVALVNDRTQSMWDNGDRMTDLQNATTSFIERLQDPTEVGVTSYGPESRIDINLTTDYQAAIEAIENYNRPDSIGNDFSGGMLKAQDVLLNGSLSTADADKTMIWATDSAVPSGQRDDVRAAADEIRSNNITIYAVGFGDEIDEQLLTDVTNDSDRVYTSPDSADLESIYENIIADISDLQSSGLRVETRHLFEPGATHPYTVTNVTYVTENNETEIIREDVTDAASLTSSNTSVLTVDEPNTQLEATQDPDTATWVRVDAVTQNRSGCTNVIVAQPTVENLELVPGIWRAAAIAGDATLFALLIATLLAVPAARFTSAFGGLALAQMVVVVAWFAGYINFGIAAASLFVALFIGLNLAANIDYQAGNLGRR